MASLHRNTFVPFLGQASNWGIRAKLQSSRDPPIRMSPQYISKDVASGDDEELQDEQSGDDGKLQDDEDMPSGDDDELQDLDAVPDLVAGSELDAAPARESNSTRALENMMTQNAYLRLVSKADIETLQEDSNLADLWTQTEKFVNDCDREMKFLRYIRGTCAAAIELIRVQDKDEDQKKMLASKTEHIEHEFIHSMQRGVQLLNKDRALAEVLNAATGRFANHHFREALIKINRARFASSEDFHSACSPRSSSGSSGHKRFIKQPSTETPDERNRK
jgi:hypothetical protein